jgi:hypothetical protein
MKSILSLLIVLFCVFSTKAQAIRLNSPSKTWSTAEEDLRVPSDSLSWKYFDTAFFAFREMTNYAFKVQNNKNNKDSVLILGSQMIGFRFKYIDYFKRHWLSLSGTGKEKVLQRVRQNESEYLDTMLNF